MLELVAIVSRNSVRVIAEPKRSSSIPTPRSSIWLSGSLLSVVSAQ
jgi:hypothetical protein